MPQLSQHHLSAFEEAEVGWFQGTDPRHSLAAYPAECSSSS